MFRTRLIPAVLTAATLAMPAAAANFTFTSSLYNAEISLPNSPQPTQYADGYGFSLAGSGTLNGNPASFSNITFYALFLTVLPNLSGGFSIDDTLENLFIGEQLYTGPESAPTFVAGTYNLFAADTFAEGTLVISDVGGAVPEPVSWAMMVGGFGLIGASLRARTRISFA